MFVLPLLSKCAFCELSCGVNSSISIFFLEVFVNMLFEKLHVSVTRHQQNQCEKMRTECHWPMDKTTKTKRKVAFE